MLISSKNEPLSGQIDPYPARSFPPSRFCCIFDVRDVPALDGNGSVSIAYVVDRELLHLFRVRLSHQLSNEDRFCAYLYLGEPYPWYISGSINPINYEGLSSVQRKLLKYALNNIVMSNEDVFLRVYNNARSLTIKLHSLSLLPHFGTTRIFNVMDAKRARPFESFSDINARVPLVNDSAGFIIARLLMEIANSDEKYHLLKLSGIVPNIMAANVRLRCSKKEKRMSEIEKRKRDKNNREILSQLNHDY